MVPVRPSVRVYGYPRKREYNVTNSGFRDHRRAPSVTSVEKTLELTRPLSLQWTLRALSLWGATTWLKVDESGAWYARLTKSGPGTVHICHRGDHLWVESFGEGGETILAEVPALVGLDDPGLEAVEPVHPLIDELKKRMRGCRQGRSGHVYPRLVAAGLAQKVSGSDSKPALRRLAYRWGKLAPGPREDLQLLPEPRALARRPYYEFHPLGIERHRAELVRRIADRATALQRAALMPFADARAHLEKLPGIGPWTSGVVMGGPLGDPDALPIGDYHLANWVAWNLAREPRADDERMLELLEPYAGRRGLVARLIKLGGSKPPRFGPRRPHVDIRKL